MRVGFTGAQGTGKTSVASMLITDPAMVKRKWTFVPSTSRSLSKAGYKINREADELSQLLITNSRMAAEYEAETDTMSILSDRTPLDSLAYTAYQQSTVWKKEPNEYFKISQAVVLEHMKRYDLVFHFPVYWAPKKDADRDDSTSYQNEVALIIEWMLTNYNIPHINMPNSSVEERVALVRARILN